MTTKQEDSQEIVDRVSSAYADHLFSYHQPKGNQPERYQAIRDAAKVFAAVLLANTKPSADQSAAIRKLRECVMTANASIALEQI